MHALELLSQSVIRKRLREIKETTAHLKNHLPPESPYNKELRVWDVANFTGIRWREMENLLRDDPPPKWRCKCGSVDNCVRSPRCRPMSEKAQRDLSRFFQAYDSGILAKGQGQGSWVGGVEGGLWKPGRWKIFSRSAPLPREQQHIDAGVKQIGLRIDMKTFGLKVRG